LNWQLHQSELKTEKQLQSKQNGACANAEPQKQSPKLNRRIILFILTRFLTGNSLLWKILKDIIIARIG